MLRFGPSRCSATRLLYNKHIFRCMRLTVAVVCQRFFPCGRLWQKTRFTASMPTAANRKFCYYLLSTFSECWLCGPLNRPQYRSCPPVCSFVRLSVFLRPVWSPNLKTIKSRKKQNCCKRQTFARESNWCASFKFKRS